MSSSNSRQTRPTAIASILSLLLLSTGCHLIDEDDDSDASDGNLGAGPGADQHAPEGSSRETDSKSSNSKGTPASKSAKKRARSGGDTTCGLDVLPSPASLSTHPCEEGEPVVSETVSRSAGPPDRTTETFELESASELCITIENGADPDSDEKREGEDHADGDDEHPGKGGRGDESEEDGSKARSDRGSSNEHHVTAAWISVDGERVIGPDAFRRDIDTLQKTLELSGGEHEIRVRLASKPGTSIGVEVRAAPGAPSKRSATGRRGIVRVDNVAVDHPLFSPNADDYHDTILFNADAELPLGRRLRTRDVSHTLDWEWRIVSADTCSAVDVDLSGTTPLEGPTNVQLVWDGETSSGSTAPDGSYIYQFRAEVLRPSGRVVDRVTSSARGFVLDTSQPDLDPHINSSTCDPRRDPHDCKCPGSTPKGTRCTFAWIPYLEDFDNPANLQTGKFVTSHRDPKTGRWNVVIDLRTYNGGGLVPQDDGRWKSLDALQNYVSRLTGVPADPNDERLFNFDYTQLGYSRPVVRGKGVQKGFNHFLLDVITDAQGEITISGRTIDLRKAFRSRGTSAPNSYAISDPRLGKECGYNGNTDGDDVVRSSSCTDLRVANLDPNGTNLGIYIFEKQVFDIQRNGQGTTVEKHCVINGIVKCGVRTLQRNGTVRLRSRQYVQTEEIRAVRDLESRVSGVPALVQHTDRHFDLGNGGFTPIDGVCSSDETTLGPMSIPLDSGVGALPPACVINGIV